MMPNGKSRRDREVATQLLRGVATEAQKLTAQNAKLRDLVQTLIDNDPDEPIADSGETVLDLWRHQAKRVLEE